MEPVLLTSDITINYCTLMMLPWLSISSANLKENDLFEFDSVGLPYFFMFKLRAAKLNFLFLTVWWSVDLDERILKISPAPGPVFSSRIRIRFAPCWVTKNKAN